MPKTRHVIRKVDRGELVDFDEQLWPVNCALIVLGGFAAGGIVATSDFATPDPLRNGWVRLASVGVLLLLLLFSTLYFHRRRAVRRIQFAVLMSLLLHLWLGLGLQQFYLTAFTSDADDAPAARAEDEQFVTLPDYGPMPSEEEAADDPLTAPVETATPEAESAAVARQETAEGAAAQATSAPADAPAAQPGAVAMERQETAAARRSDERSGQQLSRQIAPGRDQPSESVPLPDVAPSQPAQDAPADSRAAARRQQTEFDASRRAAAAQAPDAAERVATAEFARRAADAQPQSATPSDAPARESAAAATPSPEQVAAESVAERSSESQAADARAAAVRAENSPDEARPTAAPDSSSPAAVARTEAPRRERRTAPRPERIAAAAPSRSPSDAARADDAQAQPGEVASAAPSSAPALEAQSTTGRPNAASDLPSAPASQVAEAADAAEGAPAAATASSHPRRAEAAPAASTNASSGQIARRSRSAAVASGAAEAADGSTASAGTPEAQTAEARPAAAGARRAGGSPAGGLASARSEEAPAAGGASGPAAARRASSADSDAAGPTLPNASTSLARTTAGAGSASGRAEAGAEQVAVSEAGDDGSGGELEAAGSAAAARQASGGPAGSATGMAGAAEPAAQAGAIASAAGRASTRDSEVGAGVPSEAPGVGRAQVAARDVPGAAVDDGGAPSGARVAGRGASELEGPSREAGSARGERTTAVGALAGGSAVEANAGASAGSVAGTATGSARRGESGPRTGQVAGAPLGRTSSTAAAPSDAGLADGAEVASAGTAGEAGQPLEARGGGASRQSTQIAAAATGGANEGEAGPAATASAGATGSPRRSDGDGAPAAQLAGRPLGRSSRGVSPDLEASADELGPVASASVAQSGGIAGTLEADASGSRAAASLPVAIAAQAGPGGLSNEPSPQVGIPDRRARPQSEVVQVSSGRFVLSKSAGGQTVDATADPAPAFRQRMSEERARRSRSLGGSEGSERAVEMGLDFLARHQSPDGHWSLHAFAEGRGEGYENASPGTMQADTAATGLALLTFLGAGYSHLDGKYRDVVEGGVAWLVAHQKEDGDLFSGGSKYVWLYSHGIASIALCEAYGMTADPVLREPAQRALNFIAAAQHPTQGGWRYAPQVGTDTSVSGWQMMALKSGELAGLEVPSGCYEGVRGWLELAQGPARNPARYAYRPSAENRHQREPSKAMTAEALLMRLYLGWERENPSLVDGADYLTQHLPEFGDRESPQRDAYYWYYATQVMFQMQGPHWEAWNGRLRPLLTETQVVDGPLSGSWDPGGQVADRWASEAGRIYVTALHLLMLEVYYRHLPLYQTLGGE